MSIQEGDKLPEATLHMMQEGRPTPMTTADLFGGKKVVMFAVPGAFTPTCSQAHLPGYVVNADAIKDVQLFKGAYPAKYGGRLSSVVDLTGKT